MGYILPSPTHSKATSIWTTSRRPFLTLSSVPEDVGGFSSLLLSYLEPTLFILFLRMTEILFLSVSEGPAKKQTQVDSTCLSQQRAKRGGHVTLAGIWKEGLLVAHASLSNLTFSNPKTCLLQPNIQRQRRLYHKGNLAVFELGMKETNDECKYPPKGQTRPKMYLPLTDDKTRLFSSFHYFRMLSNKKKHV